MKKYIIYECSSCMAVSCNKIKECALCGSKKLRKIILKEEYDD